MTSYKLSFVLTTYNKLPYLQQVLTRLVEARQPDEEIVVCDGGSTDGTPEYLNNLYKEGKIQQFVSERDKGEAHGFNKGMLLAKGEIIKIITDDDAFCYPAIRHAANFMLEHPDIDVMGGNAWNISLEDLSQIGFVQYSIDNFRHWQTTKEPVNILGLPLLIRRSSLALTGLFYTGMVQVDGEFTYRITSLNVNIAWCSAILSIRIDNPKSNFRNMNSKDGEREVERMQFFYKNVTHDLIYWIRNKSELVNSIRKPIRPIKALLKKFKKEEEQYGVEMCTGFTENNHMDRIEMAFKVCDNFIEENNDLEKVEYLYKSSGNSIEKVMKLV